MVTKFKPTAAQSAILKRLQKDSEMREAIAAYINRDENTIRQWAAYRPWCFFGNAAAVERAAQYIAANPVFKKTA